MNLRTERGIALVTVMLVTFAILTLAVAASIIGTNTALFAKYRQREAQLQAVADAGIEEVRSAINGTPTMMPNSSYVATETNAVVYDAAGAAIPGVTRTTYIGPTGITSGQYGVYGSVVTVVKDVSGNTLVRRGEVYQESFAKYAYFTNVEGAIYFANGDNIFGPVHSNDVINIYNTGATFWAQVTTAKTISGLSYGTFKKGYIQNAPTIAFPTTATMSKLQAQAAAGGTSIVGKTTGALGQATTRIEFVAIDLNADGNTTDANEGFFRIYQSDSLQWVVADAPNTYGATGLRDSPNCGDFHLVGATQVFKSALSHFNGTSGTTDTWQQALVSTQGPGHRCYLGGADTLWGTAGFQAVDAYGGWVPWPGAVSPLVAARPDAAYLWPLARSMNPNFKGVIYVGGNVVVSGRLRGHVTLVASGNIVVADNLQYVTDPGLGSCADVLGMFAGNDVVMADNTLNSPQQPQGSGAYLTYKSTKDEFVHGFVLALTNFTAENYTLGPTNAEGCQGKPDGRGCLFLTGGLIQYQRGPVGLTDGHGYIKRYSYDACGTTDPPPYFPTTGHYAKGHYFEVDPTGFNVATYFSMLTPK